MNSQRQAVVVGAGISGLSCAYRLKRLGIDVLLIESSDRVGGVIRTENVDGYLIERGPNSSQGSEELLALVEELGISDDLVEGDPRAPAYVYFGGRLHPVPSGPGPFLSSKLLSFGGKLRILGEPLVKVRRTRTEESVASFATRRIGRQAAERLVAPFVSGIYAGDADQLSVQAAFPRLANLETNYGGLFRGTLAKAREAKRAKKSAADVVAKAAPTRRRLISFKEGMAHLPAALGTALGEDLSTDVVECKVQRAPSSPAGSDERSGFTVEFTRKGIGHRVSTDSLVIATTASAASVLASDLDEELSGLLCEIKYPKLAVVHLSYDVDRIDRKLDGFGFLVAPKEPLNILGCVWNSSLFRGRAPEGKALLTVFAGGARNPQVVDLPDDELVSRVHADLARALGISCEPTIISITRYERAIPQYNIGHAARVQRIESLIEAVPGLFLVGNYLHGVSTGDCIKHSETTTTKIAAFLGL
jgi:oxygen-dependent protoporphyrinogen oxidase